jgi:O-methyltransferase
MDIISELIALTPRPSELVTVDQAEMLLRTLSKVVEAKIPGDVAEFGCYKGDTTILLRKFLSAVSSAKKLHVFDTFQGLPLKTNKDAVDRRDFGFGEFFAPRDHFEKRFTDIGLAIPVIHQGMFEMLSNADLPGQFCFAFLDGDLYQSILTSLKIVYKRLAKGGFIIVHDYFHGALPGVKVACDEFVSGKQGLSIWARCGCAVIEKASEEPTRAWIL